MTIQEHLSLADGVFDRIFDLVKSKDYDFANIVIRDAEQPKEWVAYAVGVDGQDYGYNKIQLIEALMDRLYINWGVESGSTPLVVADKNGHSISISLTVWYMDLDRKTKKYIYGGASIYAPHPTHIAPLTAKCIIEAKKNAIKQLGGLFGRSLNRVYDDAQMPVIKVVADTYEEDAKWAEIKKGILSANSYDDALLIINANKDFVFVIENDKEIAAKMSAIKNVK